MQQPHSEPKTVQKKSPEPGAVPAKNDDIPRIAICIDDFGADLEIAHRFLDKLDHLITFAVIPRLKYSNLIIREVGASRHDTFLHLPMEPMDSAEMGSAADTFLTTSMSDDILEKFLLKLLDEIPPVNGVNNHMGSKFTSDAHRMRTVLRLFKKRNLPFLDSRTTAKTVAADVAVEIGLPHVSRAVFLDQGYKGGDVSANLDKLVAIARKRGFSVGIGHARKETLEVLLKRLPEIERDGVRIVRVVDLMSASGN